MKRRLQVVLVAALFAAALTAWFVVRRASPRAELSDGASLRLLDARIGAHTNLSDRGPLANLTRALPAAARAYLSSLFGASANNLGRSWYHVPADTNSLHVWVKREAPFALAKPRLSDHPATIVDADGWVWLNHGLAHAQSSGAGRVDYLNYSFAGFPRWADSLEVVFWDAGAPSDGELWDRLGSMRIPNPSSPAHPERWIPKPLPQTTRFDTVEATLLGIHFRNDWRSSRMPPEMNSLVPTAQLQLAVIEAVEPDQLRTNLWHEVGKSFFDNYGNNSHSGLPPRRPSDTNAPPLQWRVIAELVGDHRSRAASNHLLSLPPVRLPGGGERGNVETASMVLDGLTVSLAGIVGAGHTDYTNGALATNYIVSPLPNTPRQSSTTGDAGSRLSLTSASPHVGFAYTGSVDELWFSLRASEAGRSESKWLTERHDARSKPAFRKIYNDPGLFWFSCEGLDTNSVWEFQLGVHRVRRAEFILDRPLWTP